MGEARTHGVGDEQDDAGPSAEDGAVDRAALDDQNLIFKREGGGFPRLNKLFDGQLDQVLKHFNDSVWPQAQ